MIYKQNFRFSVILVVLLVSILCNYKVFAQEIEKSSIEEKEKKEGFEVQRIFKGNHYYKRRKGFYTSDKFSYSFSFDESSIYKILDKNGNLGEDHYDWNKLAGASDCGSFDLSVNGAMFAWRATAESYLEITAYSNVNGKHIYPTKENGIPIFVLKGRDLKDFNPVNYTIEIKEDKYQFNAIGILHDGRKINYQAILPRGCIEKGYLKNFSYFYFGGDKTAPHDITGYYREELPLPELDFYGVLLNGRKLWDDFIFWFYNPVKTR